MTTYTDLDIRQAFDNYTNPDNEDYHNEHLAEWIGSEINKAAKIKTELKAAFESTGVNAYAINQLKSMNL